MSFVFCLIPYPYDVTVGEVTQQVVKNELLSAIDNSLKREVIPQAITDKLMQKACKSAIKGGKKLSQSEVDYLMELLGENLDLKCPHGRPIAVKITKYELEKWFKRLV